MEKSTKDRISTLDHLIREAEARRIEQMLHIATLLADGESASKAEEGLRQIQQLLMRMRAQQRLERTQMNP